MYTLESFASQICTSKKDLCCLIKIIQHCAASELHTSIYMHIYIKWHLAASSQMSVSESHDTQSETCTQVCVRLASSDYPTCMFKAVSAEHAKTHKYLQTNSRIFIDEFMCTCRQTRKYLQ